MSLNKFERFERLGQGSFGNVFKVKCNGVYYCLKLISYRQISDRREQIFETNSFVKSLRHDNIIQIYDVFKSNEIIDEFSDIPVPVIGIQMELCDIDLRQFLYSHESFNLNVRADIFSQILNGTKYLHSNHITHRDLNPSNILIKRLENSKICVKISDFDLIKFFVPDLTYSNEINNTGEYGSVMYTAPEIPCKRYDQKSDIYSLGIILGEMWCNFESRHEFNEEFSTSNNIEERMNNLGKIPEKIQKLILQMTKLDFVKRPSIEQVINTFTVYVDELNLERKTACILERPANKHYSNILAPYLLRDIYALQEDNNFITDEEEIREKKFIVTLKTTEPRETSRNEMQLEIPMDSEGEARAHLAQLCKIFCCVQNIHSTSQTSSVQVASNSGQKLIDKRPSKIMKNRKGTYDMSKRPRGFCVIINNVAFKELDTRFGSDRDAKNLEEVWEELRFKVLKYRNLKSYQMKNILENVQTNIELANHNALVVIILTHGNSGELFGVDDQTVKTDDIIYLFNDENCLRLSGKPKMFFFNACREYRVNARYSGISGTPSGIKRLSANTYVYFSSIDGYVSYRDENRGSLFGWALYCNLKRHSSDRDLSHIMTLVGIMVSEMANKENCYQETETRLIGQKFLYLNRKL